MTQMTRCEIQKLENSLKHPTWSTKGIQYFHCTILLSFAFLVNIKKLTVKFSDWVIPNNALS